VTTVETERLLLRPLEMGDLDAFAPVWADAVVMRHIGSGAPRDREGSQELLTRLVAHWAEHGFGLWAVVPKGEAAPVGWAGLMVPSFLPSVLPAVEVGWLLARPWWGRGLASEAGAAAINWGFGGLGLDRLISIIYADNTPSLRVADRLGMTRWATEQHPRTRRELALYERRADRNAPPDTLATPA
jgi:RimJ/RimL family protein N-acetyltransferase